MIAKDYLGDSVYAEEMPGGMIRLTTENDSSGPGNEIYLEPEVMRALMCYIERCNTDKKKGGETR